MAITKSLALVLRSRNYRETSLIFSAIVPGQGTLHFLGKGFREKHRGFLLPFEPLTLLEAVYYEHTRSHFQLLKEADAIERFDTVRRSITTYAQACYLADLVDQLVSGGLEEPHIFDLLIAGLNHVGRTDAERLIETFQVKLLETAGFLPQLHRCVACGTDGLEHAVFGYEQGGVLCRRCGISHRNVLPLSTGTLETLRYLAGEPFERALQLKQGRKTRFELKTILRRFIAFRLEGELKTLRVLDQMGRVGMETVRYSV